MPRNGSGLYSLPAGSIVQDGVDDILASQHNTPLQDLASDANAARPIVAGGTGATTAAGARTNLGLAIGTNVQAYDAALQSLAGLSWVADRYAFTTGVDTFDMGTITAFGRSILDDADAAAVRTTIGAQASDAALTSLAGLPLAAGDVLYATGADTVARLPIGTAGQILQTNTGATAPEWTDRRTVLGPFATTSGSSVLVTGIPSWAKTIIIAVHNGDLSASGAAWRVQIGPSGGVETTGYVSSSTWFFGNAVNAGGGTGAGFELNHNNGTNVITLEFVLRLVATNTWQMSGSGSSNGGGGVVGNGRKTTASAIDRLVVSPSTGTFVAGEFYVICEA